MLDAMIEPVRTEAELWQVRALFREYARSLDVDLCFQSFEEELAGLPGAYAPPRGRLLLAWHQGEPAGCAALRPLEGRDAEMKRLFVRPAFRRLGVGRALAEAILAEARAIGYETIRLDTLPSMQDAQRLYAELGFRPAPAYRPNPVAGAVFLERTLG